MKDAQSLNYARHARNEGFHRRAESVTFADGVAAEAKEPQKVI